MSRPEGIINRSKGIGAEEPAVAFVTDCPVEGGCPPGVPLGSYRFGEGRFVINKFPVLEHLDEHPAADPLLLNMISYAAGFVAGPPARLASDFDSQLKSIGYLE